MGRKGGLIYAGLIALAARAARLLPRRAHLRKGRRQSCKMRRTISPQAQSSRTLGCKHGLLAILGRAQHAQESLVG